MSTQSLDGVRDLVNLAEHRLNMAARYLGLIRERLDSPLRIAIAGKVKAGKSTLLNSLLGERLAPTDAAECTKLVTWYQRHHGPEVQGMLQDGDNVSLPYMRRQGELHVDLGIRQLDEFHHVEVGWPTEELRDLVFVDTPGLGSISAGISETSESFLVGGRRAPGEADGVIYLMRCLHPSDVDFLEAFRDTLSVSGSTVNAIGVISRADEIAGASLDAMDVAAAVAERYRNHRELRMRCQSIVPVAGLLAQGALQLDEADRRAFRAINSAPGRDRVRALRSAAMFVSHGDVPLEAHRRAELLERYGLFGVRLATKLLQEQPISTERLRQELRERSGLVRLQRVLQQQFASRGRTLQARTAVAAVKAVAQQIGGEAGDAVLDAASDYELRTHAFRELHAVHRLRTNQVPPEQADRAERVLGASGVSPAARLGVGEDTSPDRLAELADQERQHWAIQSQFAHGVMHDVIETVMHSLDGVMHQLEGGTVAGGG